MSTLYEKIFDKRCTETLDLAHTEVEDARKEAQDVKKQLEDMKRGNEKIVNEFLKYKEPFPCPKT